MGHNYIRHNCIGHNYTGHNWEQSKGLLDKRSDVCLNMCPGVCLNMCPDWCSEASMSNCFHGCEGGVCTCVHDSQSYHVHGQQRTHAHIVCAGPSIPCEPSVRPSVRPSAPRSVRRTVRPRKQRRRRTEPCAAYQHGGLVVLRVDRADISAPGYG